MSTSGPDVPFTEDTGRMLAYRSSFLRNATIGEEYPVTFLEGELTAPNIAALHSILSALNLKAQFAYLLCLGGHILNCRVWQSNAIFSKVLESGIEVNEFWLGNVGSERLECLTGSLLMRIIKFASNFLNNDPI